MPFGRWKYNDSVTLATVTSASTNPIITWDAGSSVTGGTWAPTTWTTDATVTWAAVQQAVKVQWPPHPQWVAPIPSVYVPPGAFVETPEQRNARWAMRDRYAQEQAGHDHAARLASRAAHLEHERANGRAERLLIEHLSPQQAEELRASGHFHVRLLNGRRYRISRGQHGNVVEVDGAGRGLRSLCVQPVGHLPDADAMLAQKLWLETDEATLLRTANITPMRARA